MTVDVSTLAISVKTDGIKETGDGLNRIYKESDKAEKRVITLTEKIGLMSKAFQGAALNANTYQTALAGINRSSNASDAAIGQLVGVMKTMTKVMSELMAAVTLLSKSIKTLGENMTAGAAQVNGATNFIRRNTLAMTDAQAAARGLAGSLGQLWVTYGSFAGMAVGIALGVSLKNIIQIGMEVEKQLNFVQALTGSKVKLDDFLAITSSSVQSVTEAGEAMRALAQNGLSVNQSLSALPTVLNLATVGEMNVGQAALAATGAVSAFGLEMTEVGRVADIFAKTAATSNTSVLAMTESMKQASTVSSLFGVTIEETAAMLGTLAKINITGGAAGTALTNMLTGLFEPTEQAKKAMDRLGVSSFDATGKMKNSVLLMEEIKMASINLSDQVKTDIFGAMFTTRGLKAFSLFQDNLDLVKTKIGENEKALGFMQGVVTKLEDSSSGAFTRLGVIVSNEFTSAFATASTEVQRLGINLGTLFKGNGEQYFNETTGAMEKQSSTIGNLLTNILVLTNLLVENVTTVVSVIAAYTAYKMIMGSTILVTAAAGGSVATLSGLIAAHRAAVIANSVAQQVAITTSVAHTTALAAGASTTALFTAATTAQTAATTAATVATGTFQALLIPFLAAAAIAVAAVAAAWLLLRDNVTDASAANDRMANTIDTINDALDKEATRLKRVNGLWDERNKKYLDSTAVTPEAMADATSNRDMIRMQVIKKSGGRTPEEINARALAESNIPGMDIGVSGNSDYTGQLGRLMLDFNEATKNVTALQAAAMKSLEVVAAKSTETTRNSLASLKADVTSFVNKAKEENTSKQLYETNPKRLAIYNEGKKILTLIDELNTSTLKGPDVTKAQERIAALRVDYKQLQDKLSKETTNPVETKKTPGGSRSQAAAENDAYAAAVIEINNKIKASKRELRNFEETQDAAFRAGQMGKLEYIMSVGQKEVETYSAIAKQIDAEIAKAQNSKNKKADVEKFTGQKEANTEATENARRRMAQETSVYLAAVERETTENRIKELENQGKFAEATTLKYSGSFNLAIKQAEAEFAKFGYIIPGIAENLEQLKATKVAAILAAENKEAVASFDNLSSSISNVFKSVKTDSTGLGLGDMFEEALSASRRYAASLEDLKQRQGGISNQKDQIEAQKEMIRLGDQQRKMWEDVGASISKSLGDAFGNAGKAAGEFLQVAITANNTESMLAEKKAREIQNITDNQLIYKDAAAEVAKVNISFAQKETQARLKSYGGMAAAAKGFFKEGSTGYKIMDGIAKASHLASLAMSVQEFVVKSGLLTSLFGVKATTAAAGEAVDKGVTQSSVANSMIRAGADGVAAFAKAISSLPPPFNFVAGAAVIAALAGVGIAIAGGGSSGGGGMTSTQKQEANGTGSVLGDENAKSESLLNAIEALEENSNIELTASQGMLKALNSIRDNIGSISSLVSQQSGLRATPADAKSVGVGSKPGFFGIGAKTTTIRDSGITVGGGQTVGSVAQGGFNARGYTDVQKTNSGFFGIGASDKTRRQFSDLDADLTTQFGLTIGLMRTGVLEAAGVLKLGTEGVASSIDAMAINLSDISFKDLTGAQIEEELQATFSKIGDDIATIAAPGLSSFRRVGEGMLETLVRVATGVDSAKLGLDRLGIASIAYENIINKQGDVAAEITRQSIIAVESLDSNVVGVGSIINALSGSADDLLEMYQSLLDVRQLMGNTGITGDVSLGLIGGAGGLENLTNGLSDYLDKFFTAEEKAAAGMKNVTAEFTKLGLTTPTTLKAFRDLVDTTGRATPEADRLTGQLLNLSGAFADAVEAVNDLNESVKTSKEIASERKSLQEELNSLTMTESQLLALKAATYDVSNQRLFFEIVGLKDLAAARLLEIQIMELSGNVVGALAAKRQDELAKISPANRALQAHVYILQDKAEADKIAKENTKLLADSVRDYAAVMKEYDSKVEQRANLNIRILELSGKAADTLAAKRALELTKIDAVNRPLQEHIFKLEDYNTAIEALTTRFADAMKIVDTAFAGLQRSVDAEKELATKAYDDAVKAAQKSNADQGKLLKERQANEMKVLKDTQIAQKKLADDNLRTAEDALSVLKGVFDALTNAVKSTKIETLELNRARRESAQNYLASSLASTNTGGSFDAKALDDALETIAKPSEDLYASFEDYARDQGVTSLAIDGLLKNSKVGLDKQQLFVDSLRNALESMELAAIASVDSLQKIHDQEQEAFDNAHIALMSRMEQEHVANIARLDMIVTNAQIQIDRLNGIDNSVKSLNNAMASFASAVVAATSARPPPSVSSGGGGGSTPTNPVVPTNPVAPVVPTLPVTPIPPGPPPVLPPIDVPVYTPPTLTPVPVVNVPTAPVVTPAAIEKSSLSDIVTSWYYSNVNAFKPDAAGVAYWANEVLNNGISAAKDNFNNTVANITNTPVQSFAVGTNYIPKDMLAQVHEGERIIPKADNARLMDYLSNPRAANDDMVAELRDVKSQLSTLQEVIMSGDLALARNSAETMKILRKWDGEGQPEVRTVAA